MYFSSSDQEARNIKPGVPGCSFSIVESLEEERCGPHPHQNGSKGENIKKGELKAKTSLAARRLCLRYSLSGEGCQGQPV